MKKSFKIFITISIVLIFVVTMFCIKVNAATKGIITEEIVNVREKTSTDSKIIMYVSVNDKVDILEKTGDWYKIKYKNKEGYVYSDFVKVNEEDMKNITYSEASKSEDDEVTLEVDQQLYLIAGTNIKITPNIVSTNIYTATTNTNITLLEQVNNWSYISINDNLKGWVKNEDIKEGSEEVQSDSEVQEENKEEQKQVEKNETKTAFVKYDNVNLRKEPSTDSSVVEKLKLNTQVTIIKEVDPVWNKVKVGNSTGYISQDLLSSEKQKEDNKEENADTTSRDGDSTKRENEKTKTVETTQTKKAESKPTTAKKTETSTNTTKKQATTKGEEIVAYAMKFLGKPYVYGGSSPSGFDCSGFTSYVYKHFGYTISRSSVAQASEGKKVAKKDLQPGDLVIYKNQSLTRVGHVGLYIGNNKMIHASEPGVGVIITDINAKSHNYPKRFVMGRRIIK